MKKILAYLFILVVWYGNDKGIFLKKYKNEKNEWTYIVKNSRMGIVVISEIDVDKISNEKEIK